MCFPLSGIRAEEVATSLEVPVIVKSVNEAEVIALSEYPNVDFSDKRGRLPTPEEASLVDALADSMFFKRSFDEQIEDILHFPPHVSARRLAQMPAVDSNRLLSHVPKGLAEDIASLLSVEVA